MPHNTEVIEQIVFITPLEVLVSDLYTLVLRLSNCHLVPDVDKDIIRNTKTRVSKEIDNIVASKELHYTKLMAIQEVYQKYLKEYIEYAKSLIINRKVPVKVSEKGRPRFI